MMDELKDVFALATGCTAFVNELLKIKNTKNKLQQNDISGDSAQLASSGYSAQLASSGDYAQLASSGDYAQLASSGDYAKLASSGDSAQLASSGYSAQLASSGDYAKLASSGDSAQLASSGDYAKLASSGDSAKLDSTGTNAVISAIGINNIVRAKKGTWITLAEYDENDTPRCVKSAQIDGVKLKEDVYYTLLNGEFTECVNIDGIISIVLNKHKNVYKVQNLNSNRESYIVQDGDIYSHGDTIQEAKNGLLFKISNRDTSKYNDFTKETNITLKEAIEMYRIITGACEGGTRYFVENVLADKKEKYTVQEVIDLTQGQYNHAKLVEFFKNK
uniref:Uncharacterized protein n=1 Tax=Dulem virus 31 TaxID=3145749 RepID=A0AAU8ATA3_9VIRU